MAELHFSINGDLEYSYDRVNGSILSDYLTRDGLEAYLSDEVFEETVINSYQHLDLRLQKDQIRVENKKRKVANWLEKEFERMGLFFIKRS